MRKRFAAIDIGSNSSLLLILELGSDCVARTIIDTKISTRLSEGTQKSGEIGEAALARQFNALNSFAETIRNENVDHVVACGTQVFRVARNGKGIAGEIGRRYGWTMEIISGDREAQLSYLAAGTGLSGIASERIVLDVGGGSSEVIFGRGAEIIRSQSFPIGAVNLTEKFGLYRVVDKAVLNEVAIYLDDVFGPLDTMNPFQNNSASLIAVAGTAVTLTGIKMELKKFDPKQVHGVQLTRGWISEILRKLGSIESDKRREFMPFDPDRAEIIVGGASILEFLANKLKTDVLTVSNCGLRWGLIMSAFPQLSGVTIEQ